MQSGDSSLAPSSAPWRGRILILATPILWWLAGAFQLFPLGWLALAPLFVYIHDQPTQVRFKRGYWVGFLSFWLINWWLLPTITRGSSMIGVSPVWGLLLGLLSVTIIAAGHAFLPAISAAAARGNGLVFSLFAATAWTVVDYVRSIGPLANTWGSLAFTQTSDPYILPLARFVGQHGLTFGCVLLAALAAQWFLSRQRSVATAFVGILLVAHGLGAWRVASYAAPEQADGLKVLLVQTNISSLGVRAGEPAMQQAWRLTSKAIQENPDVSLVVWPETSVRLQRHGDGTYYGLDWEVWWQLKAGIPLLTGAHTTNPDGKRFNEAVFISPDGKVQSYAKMQLVPFGERAPLVEYLPLLQIFAPNPMLERGEEARLLNAPQGKLLRPLICFESCFPTQTTLNGRSSDAIVVVTNDEWFAGTEVPRQHRAMGQLRAAENGVPLLQSCNGSYAFWANSLGKIEASTSNANPEVIVARLR